MRLTTKPIWLIQICCLCIEAGEFDIIKLIPFHITVKHNSIWALFVKYFFGSSLYGNPELIIPLKLNFFCLKINGALQVKLTINFDVFKK